MSYKLKSTHKLKDGYKFNKNFTTESASPSKPIEIKFNDYIKIKKIKTYLV